MEENAKTLSVSQNAQRTTDQQCLDTRVNEIIRSYGRAHKEGYEMHLNANSIKFYLDTIIDLKCALLTAKVAPIAAASILSAVSRETC